MPYKPKTPCGYPGCPKLSCERYCEEHKKTESARYEKYHRNPVVRKRYGSGWRRIRDKYISEYPLCEECRKHSKLTPAEEVHHIIPLAKGGTHAEDNLMSLCTPCHSAITARDGDRWQNKTAL